jgi:hypothetical protein
MICYLSGFEFLIDFIPFLLLFLPSLYFLKLVALVGGIVHLNRWVLQVERGIEFEVDKFDQN